MALSLEPGEASSSAVAAIPTVALVASLAALLFLSRATFKWASRTSRDRDVAVLPNGLKVFSHQIGETRYLYKEVWEQREYVQHGVNLKPGDVVFDVGANIGMFSIFAANECAGDITVHAFEPIPDIYGLMAKNLRRHISDGGGRAVAHNVGLSDSPGAATFNFHTNFSLHSTGHTDFEERRKARLENDVPAMLEGLRSSGEMPRWLTSYVPKWVLHKLGRFAVQLLSRFERVEVKLVTLTSVVRDFNVNHIDLLKIDVEGFEEKVLSGISSSDWEKIRQVALEVEDFATTRRVTRLLEGLGFRVTSEASEKRANPRVSSEVSQIWAWRPGNAKE
eukprot:g1737.t1